MLLADIDNRYRKLNIVTSIMLHKISQLIQKNDFFMNSVFLI